MGMLDDDNGPFESWSLEKQRAAYEGMQRNDSRLQVSKGNADIFLANHPEFVDSKANSQLMNHQLKTMFGVVAYTLEQFEAAYQALRASNFLALNLTEVAKQEKQQAENVAKVTPVFDEETAYSLPMEELERRARGL